MEAARPPLVLLVLSGDLEKGLAACNLALAAASSGRPVWLFFTFWGLNFLKRPEARPGGSLLVRLLGGVNRDHSGRQRLGRFHLAGLGPWALGRILGRRGLPTVQEGLRAARGLGARVVACSATLELLGLDRAALIPEVDEVAGAAAALDAGLGGQILTLG